MELSFPYELKVRSLDCGGIPLKIDALADLDATIDSLFADYERTGRASWFEEHSPYFGVPWPAGIALASEAASRALALPLKSMRVLELGCGLALPSLALAALGAEVTATDQHPDVPAFLARNRELNNLGESPAFRLLDWRKDRSGEWDLILGSDILYDKDQPEALAAFLAESLAPGGLAWITDPGRPYLGAFLKALRDRALAHSGEAKNGIHWLEISRRI